MRSYNVHRIPESRWQDVVKAYDEGKWSDLVFLYNYYNVGNDPLCYCSSGENIARVALQKIYDVAKNEDELSKEK